MQANVPVRPRPAGGHRGQQEGGGGPEEGGEEEGRGEGGQEGPGGGGEGGAGAVELALLRYLFNYGQVSFSPTSM